MAMNPAAMFKLMGYKKQFNQNHPKVAAFVENVVAYGVPEGSVIDLTVTRPDGTTIATNMKVLASDLEMLQELKNMR